MIGNSITVYYGFGEALPGMKPEKLLNELIDTIKPISPNAIRCPSIIDFNKNIYKIYPNFDYQITFDGKNIRSNYYDQKFFNRYIIERNFKDGFFSYVDPELFLFTEEKSLVIDVLPPFFHNNNKFIRYLCGTFDIGKHLRKIELPILFSSPSFFDIKTNEPLYYVKFQTNKKINFKRFRVTEELLSLLDGLFKIRDYKTIIKPLEFYYDLVKRTNLKKTYLKIIKQNLMD